MFRMRTLTVILATSLLLAACGYKGALYLPTDKKPARHHSSKSSASAPAATVPQQTSEPVKEQR